MAAVASGEAVYAMNAMLRYVKTPICEQPYPHPVDRIFWGNCPRGHMMLPGTWRINSKGQQRCRQCVWGRQEIIENGDLDITIEALGERDGWVCRLCYEPVDPNAKSPRSIVKSIDHIRPIVPQPGEAPGTHTWDNVQLAHFGCNSGKGNRKVTVQPKNTMAEQA